jgi:rSAM-associated Gly-rich repeat protein
MTRSNRLLKALKTLLPAGALGASATLALYSVADALPNPSADTSEANSASQSVSTRLQTIRSGVTTIAAFDEHGAQGVGISVVGTSDPSGDPKATPTWWGNGGFGRWRLGWGNGGWGWHNGGFGWHNGGWGNGWHNGWGNGGWGNGWHNGGWNNFWHNG